MTLSEAIAHAEEQAKCSSNPECAENHKQLADWLKELQTITANNKAVKQGRRIEAFKFNLGDRVTIGAINRPAIVELLCIDKLGQQYRVSFWADGKRQSEWVYEWELELKEGNGCQSGSGR